jgi:hypothetical protein
MALLRIPLGGTVKIVEQGGGTPVVFWVGPAGGTMPRVFPEMS